MVNNTTTYPGKDWVHISPAEAGFDPDKLNQARVWLDHNAGGKA